MNDKLKIGFISLDDASDVRVWSGTPYHILQALQMQDVSVHVLSPLKRSFRYPLAPFKIWARLWKREVLFNHFPLAMLSYAKQVRKWMQQQPVDVLLFIGTPAFALLTCELPIVFITDAVFHAMPGYYGGLLNRLTPGAIRRGVRQEELSLQRCTIGAYASQWAAEAARRHTDPAKIRVVPFGASLPVHHGEDNVRDWVAERCSRLPLDCELLFIGVDWVRKGGAIAVEAARLLNAAGVRTKLTVVGCRPPETMPEFVEVLGFIDKQSAGGMKKLIELYKRTNFFILPTRAEAAGVVFCEASAFGVPSIGFKTGGTEDYIRDGVNGFALPLESSPDVFATSIRKILEDEEQYTALSLSAFHEYKTRLNWDNTARELVGLCREAVKANAGR